MSALEQVASLITDLYQLKRYTLATAYIPQQGIRFGGGVEVGNVLFDGATLNVNGIIGDHPEQLQFETLSYAMPLGVHGTKLVLSGSNGRFDVGAELAALQIRGTIKTYDISFTHPFIKTRFQTLLAEAGFASKDNKFFTLGYTLTLGAANCVTDANASTVNSGGTFNLNNFAETISSLSGAGDVTLGSATLTISTTFFSVMSGTAVGPSKAQAYSPTRGRTPMPGPCVSLVEQPSQTPR